jgi:hypothetical protein
MKTCYTAFKWVDVSNTARQKPAYLQGYEDGFQGLEDNSVELYESEKSLDHYCEGYTDAVDGLPNKLDKA